MPRDPAQIRVILAYKNFAARAGISHIGLGVSALNNAKVLVNHNIHVEVVPITTGQDLQEFLDADRARTITHVVVSAPWLPSAFYSALCLAYPRIQFAFNCHSNTAFLQADSAGVKLIREGMALEAGLYNFHLCGNSRRFVAWIRGAYARPCTYLPNLYYLDDLTDVHRPLWTETGGVLRIGIFGATRWQKNFMTAAGAALMIARELKAQTEVLINTARADGPEVSSIYRAIVNMYVDLPHADLIPVPWASWPDFRAVVGHCHLLLQPSYSESFNVVTADGVQQGVSSVVSDAIAWAPDPWKASVDDCFDVCRVGIGLIKDRRAALLGLNALQAHNEEGLAAWKDYLLEGKFGR